MVERLWCRFLRSMLRCYGIPRSCSCGSILEFIWVRMTNIMIVCAVIREWWHGILCRSILCLDLCSYMGSRVFANKEVQRKWQRIDWIKWAVWFMMDAVQPEWHFLDISWLLPSKPEFLVLIANLKIIVTRLINQKTIITNEIYETEKKIMLNIKRNNKGWNSYD